MLIALDERDELRAAYERLKKSLYKGAQVLKSPIGWHGGGTKVPVDVLWHPTHGIWCYGSDRRTLNRYWVVFGTQNPATVPSLTIACEINVPFEGVNRRIAGAFLRDSDDTSPALYLAHSGKVGGGRKGVGKSALRQHLRGKDQLTGVRWTDGTVSEMILIGDLESSNLVGQLANFVREIERIKVVIVNGGSKEATNVRKEGFNRIFRPEFQGTRKSASIERSVAGECNHGLIINTLSNSLSKHGLCVANDQRDLYASTSNGTPIAVFEAKTDVSTTSVYAGIGQLLFFTCMEPEPPLRYFVLPEVPTHATAERLARMGIRVLTYNLNDGVVSFPSLDDVIVAVHNSRDSR